MFFACSSSPSDNNSFRDKWIGLSEGARTHQDIFDVVQQGKDMDVASCANCTEEFKKEFLYHLELWDEWIQLQKNKSTPQTDEESKAFKEIKAKVDKSAIRINELSNSERIY